MNNIINQFDKDDAAEKSHSDACLGLGVRILPDKHRVELLFEVDDLAIDESGNPSPAGMKIGMDINSNKPLKTVAEYEATAARLETGGLPEYGIEAGKIRRITWEKYVSEGYDE